MKSVVDERTWQANELNFKLQREIEDLKGHVQQLRKEKHETTQRMTEMELELKTLKLVFNAQSQLIGSHAGGHLYMPPTVKQSESNDGLGERLERFSNNNSSSNSRNQVRRRNSLNLKFGTVTENHEEHFVEPLSEEISSISNGSKVGDYELMDQLCQKYAVPNLLLVNTSTPNNGPAYNREEDTRIQNAASQSDHVVMQMEKDTLDLRRELQDAVAGKKKAENRILA